mmetsp:Transcript_95520/g.151126  ORF Transcript_95520/g.151126 Transcript_95520/m.151126 type:complete len:81 (+) Transcript_95520:1588-1830(+)
MVAWHLGEEMVANMSRADAVVKEIENAIWPVNGAKGTANPRPLRVTIVWHREIGMLHPSVQHKPEIAPHVWHQIVHRHRS